MHEYFAEYICMTNSNDVIKGGVLCSVQVVFLPLSSSWQMMHRLIKQVATFYTWQFGSINLKLNPTDLIDDLLSMAKQSTDHNTFVKCVFSLCLSFYWQFCLTSVSAEWL